MFDIFEYIFGLFLMICLAVIIGAAVFFSVFLAFGFGPNKWECEEFSNQIGLKTSYNIWTTCMIEMPGGDMVSKEAYMEIMKNKHELTLISK